MYRDKPTVIKEETEEQKRVKNARQVMFIALVPCLCLLVIGWYWDRMSQGMSATSIIATILFSAGVAVSTAIKMTW